MQDKQRSGKTETRAVTETTTTRPLDWDLRSWSWSGKRQLLAALVVLLAAGLLWALESYLPREDLLKTIHACGKEHRQLFPVWELLSPLGGGPRVVFLALFVCIFLKRPEHVQLVVLSLLIASVFSGVLKELADRTRPDGNPYSWPSGHSIVVFTLATSICVARGRMRAWPWLMATPIAAARVFVGRHWPADVLAALGVSMAAVFVARNVPTFVTLRWVRPRHGVLLAGGWLLLLLAKLAIGQHGIGQKYAWTLFLLVILLLASLEMGRRSAEAPPDA